MRKTKIICTIGPASESEEMLRKLFLAGMNVGRFNFSHGTHEQHRERIERFRKVRDELGVPAAVMLDTKGPEIRVRDFENGEAVLQDGGSFTLTTESCLGNSQRAEVSFKRLPEDVSKGDTLLVDDGKIILQVLDTTETEIHTKVIHGGILKNHKGINVPAADLSLPFLSDADKSDLLFGIETGVDYISASFVRSREDVEAMRAFLHENGGDTIKILSKIENMKGIRNFEEILKASDGIMVARGDMGVEVAYEQLPGIQKRFIRRCVEEGKIVITATQMLESMITNPRPTRAEITDVANAVFDGTSAVMLSGESAAGKYPEEAVKAMAKIAEQAESDSVYVIPKYTEWHEMDRSDITNAVGHAACTLAEDLSAAALVAVTQSGFTASRTAKFRPKVPLIGATPSAKTYHQLSLEWGVRPVLTEEQTSLLELFRHLADVMIEEGAVEKGSLLVLTAGIPIGLSGDTNMIRVMRA